MKLVEAKAHAGKTEQVEKIEASPSTPASTNVVDLTELLRRSLGKKEPAKATATSADKKPTKAKPRRAA